MSALPELVAALRDSRGFVHKRDISAVVNCFDDLFAQGVGEMAQAVPLGDDCAALPDGQGGYQLLAIEGLVEDFITRMPWFAGYSSVMVNISDIYAMGGRPTAVVNALWGQGRVPKPRRCWPAWRPLRSAMACPLWAGTATCAPSGLSWRFPSWARPERCSAASRPARVINC